MVFYTRLRKRSEQVHQVKDMVPEFYFSGRKDAINYLLFGSRIKLVISDFKSWFGVVHAYFTGKNIIG